MTVRTYIDSSVLIAAVRSQQEISDIAMSFLFDPLREYVTSDYVRVELLPKCTFHKRAAERQFYEKFFASCSTHVASNDVLLANAISQGGLTGISGIDAIHVACAVAANAQELITSEKPTKPIHQAKSVRVISILPSPLPDDRWQGRIRKRIAATLRRIAEHIER